MEHKYLWAIGESSAQIEAMSGWQEYNLLREVAAWDINLWHSVIESIRLILNSDESELEKLQDILNKVPVIELAQSRLAMLLALHR